MLDIFCVQIKYCRQDCLIFHIQLNSLVQSCAEQGYEVYEHLFPQNSSEIFKRKKQLKKQKKQFKLETSKMIHCAWHLVTTMKKISVRGLENICPLRMKTTSRRWVSDLCSGNNSFYLSQLLSTQEKLVTFLFVCYCLIVILMKFWSFSFCENTTCMISKTR